MTNIAAHPGLYDPNERIPKLSGTRGEKCKVSYFPPLHIGCEHCGNSDLHAVKLAAEGIVHSAATVHLHPGKDIEAPFVVVGIELHDGPLIRGILEDATSEDVIGKQVTAKWLETDDGEGSTTFEPRFVLASNTGVTS